MLDRPFLPSLRNGRLSCLLFPAKGGALGRLRIETKQGPVDLVRPVPDDLLETASVFDLACFPLIPFSNRIAGGRFQFGGRTVVLPTGSFGPNALHGDGWLVPWTLENATRDEVRIGFYHEAGDWPWSYRAEQRFHLHPDRLDVTISLTNRSAEPMPAGIGLHPHFPAPPGTRIQAGVDGVWLSEDDRLPVRHTGLPDSWDFASGVSIDGLSVDNDFTGWNGHARIVWPNETGEIHLRADPVFGHALIYAPKGRGFICIEPASHMIDAVNRADEPLSGFRVLAPGETLAGTMSIAATGALLAL